MAMNGNGDTIRMLSDLIARASLASKAGVGFGGKRDIWEAAGYKQELTWDDYYGMYERQDIAGKIVDMPAVHAWRRPFTLSSSNDKFLTAFDELNKRVGAIGALSKLDRLAGIGQYGVLFLGFAGEHDYSNPAPDRAELAYVRAFPEGCAKIADREKNTASPRYDLPVMYTIEMSEGAGVKVHHSWVLHIVEDSIGDRALGRPRLKRVFNRLYDLLKIVAASPEGAWQTINRGIVANIQNDAELSPDDEAAMSDELDEYEHGLRRWIRTRGIDVTPLPSDVPDPTGIFDMLISLIASASGIPKRLLIGSERGELSSAQDEANWNKYVADRQKNHITPVIVRPFIDRMIESGNLPGADYDVTWPPLDDMSTNEELDALERAVKIVQALTYPAPADEIIDADILLERIAGIIGLGKA